MNTLLSGLLLLSATYCTSGHRTDPRTVQNGLEYILNKLKSHPVYVEASTKNYKLESLQLEHNRLIQPVADLLYATEFVTHRKNPKKIPQYCNLILMPFAVEVTQPITDFDFDKVISEELIGKILSGGTLGIGLAVNEVEELDGNEAVSSRVVEGIVLVLKDLELYSIYQNLFASPDIQISVNSLCALIRLSLLPPSKMEESHLLSNALFTFKQLPNSEAFPAWQDFFEPATDLPFELSKTLQGGTDNQLDLAQHAFAVMWWKDESYSHFVVTVVDKVDKEYFPMPHNDDGGDRIIDLTHWNPLARSPLEGADDDGWNVTCAEHIEEALGFFTKQLEASLLYAGTKRLRNYAELSELSGMARKVVDACLTSKVFRSCAMSPFEIKDYGKITVNPATYKSFWGKVNPQGFAKETMTYGLLAFAPGIRQSKPYFKDSSVRVDVSLMTATIREVAAYTEYNRVFPDLPISVKATCAAYVYFLTGDETYLQTFGYIVIDSPVLEWMKQLDNITLQEKITNLLTTEPTKGVAREQLSDNQAYAIVADPTNSKFMVLITEKVEGDWYAIPCAENTTLKIAGRTSSSNTNIGMFRQNTTASLTPIRTVTQSQEPVEKPPTNALQQQLSIVEAGLKQFQQDAYELADETLRKSDVYAQARLRHCPEAISTTDLEHNKLAQALSRLFVALGIEYFGSEPIRYGGFLIVPLINESISRGQLNEEESAFTKYINHDNLLSCLTGTVLGLGFSAAVKPTPAQVAIWGIAVVVEGTEYIDRYCEIQGEGIDLKISTQAILQGFKHSRLSASERAEGDILKTLKAYKIFSEGLKTTSVDNSIDAVISNWLGELSTQKTLTSELTKAWMSPTEAFVEPLNINWLSLGFMPYKEGLQFHLGVLMVTRLENDQFPLPHRKNSINKLDNIAKWADRADRSDRTRPEKVPLVDPAPKPAQTDEKHQLAAFSLLDKYFAVMSENSGVADSKRPNTDELKHNSLAQTIANLLLMSNLPDYSEFAGIKAIRIPREQSWAESKGPEKFTYEGNIWKNDVFLKATGEMKKALNSPIIGFGAAVSVRTFPKQTGDDTYDHKINIDSMFVFIEGSGFWNTLQLKFGDNFNTLQISVKALLHCFQFRLPQRDKGRNTDYFQNTLGYTLKTAKKGAVANDVEMALFDEITEEYLKGPENESRLGLEKFEEFKKNPFSKFAYGFVAFEETGEITMVTAFNPSVDGDSFDFPCTPTNTDINAGNPVDAPDPGTFDGTKDTNGKLDKSSAESNEATKEVEESPNPTEGLRSSPPVFSINPVSTAPPTAEPAVTVKQGLLPAPPQASKLRTKRREPTIEETEENAKKSEAPPAGSSSNDCTNVRTNENNAYSNRTTQKRTEETENEKREPGYILDGGGDNTDDVPAPRTEKSQKSQGLWIVRKGKELGAKLRKKIGEKKYKELGDNPANEHTEPAKPGKSRCFPSLNLKWPGRQPKTNEAPGTLK